MFNTKFSSLENPKHPFKFVFMTFRDILGVLIIMY